MREKMGRLEFHENLPGLEATWKTTNLQSFKLIVLTRWILQDFLNLYFRFDESQTR